MIEEVKKELDEHTKRNMTLNSVPVSVIKEFKLFCEQECGGNYAVGLFQLLKTKHTYETLYPVLLQILSEINSLKSNSRNVRRTFADE